MGIESCYVALMEFMIPRHLLGIETVVTLQLRRWRNICIYTWWLRACGWWMFTWLGKLHVQASNAAYDCNYGKIPDIFSIPVLLNITQTDG